MSNLLFERNRLWIQSRANSHDNYILFLFGRGMYSSYFEQSICHHKSTSELWKIDPAMDTLFISHKTMRESFHPSRWKWNTGLCFHLEKNQPKLNYIHYLMQGGFEKEFCEIPIEVNSERHPSSLRHIRYIGLFVYHMFFYVTSRRIIATC